MYQLVFPHLLNSVHISERLIEVLTHASRHRQHAQLQGMSSCHQPVIGNVADSLTVQQKERPANQQTSHSFVGRGQIIQVVVRAHFGNTAPSAIRARTTGLGGSKFCGILTGVADITKPVRAFTAGCSGCDVSISRIIIPACISKYRLQSELLSVSSQTSSGHACTVAVSPRLQSTQPTPYKPEKTSCWKRWEENAVKKND